jgi:hypothetical protein
MKCWYLLGIVTLTLAGCASSDSAVTVAPYLRGHWSAVEQGSFVEACDAYVSDAYCVCALGHMIDAYPDTRKLPDSIPASGVFAGERERDFPDCRRPISSARGLPTDPQDG